MKSAYSVKFFVSLVVMLLTLSSFKIRGPVSLIDRSHFKKDTGDPDGRGFAVLELFTSEGCSSCPPADELIAGIQKETAGKSIYILAYHVNYWDRLGWKDIFSSAEYSNRQLQYGRWLKVSPIYTPQVIVNGKEQFVGSEASTIHHAISEQLEINPSATLAIRARQEGDHLQLKYQAVHVRSGSPVLIAVIQKAAQSKVERGENAGRLLSHVQIVRKLQTGQLDASGNGTVDLILPGGFNHQSWEVLGLVQDQVSGEIQAVAKADL